MKTFNHQNKFLISSVVAGLLSITGVASAETMQQGVTRGDVTPASAMEGNADNTLQQRVHDERGELLATQPGRVELNQSDDRNVNARNGNDQNNAHNNIAHNSSAQNNTVHSNNMNSGVRHHTNNTPLLKGEKYSGDVNTGNVTPADMRTEPAPYTLQEKVKDKRGELLATQPGEVEFQEMRRIVRK